MLRNAPNFDFLRQEKGWNAEKFAAGPADLKPSVFLLDHQIPLYTSMVCTGGNADAA
jgi:hypothetical protein